MPSVLLHLGWAGTKVGVSSLTAHVKASLPPQLTAFGEFSIAIHIMRVEDPKASCAIYIFQTARGLVLLLIQPLDGSSSLQLPANK